MKSIILAVLAVVSPALAHYRFTNFVLNGAATGDYIHVRRNTNYNSPVTDVMSNDMRCNVGGLASGSATQTATVAAGATVGFRLDQAIFHPGPAAVYLGKVPSGQTAASWDGSGANWFKIYEVGATIGAGTISWPADTQSAFNFRIPSSIPAGQYLLRIEHIALHSATNYPGAQIYISCAQINVTGGGSANPAKVSIPGAYTGSDPGIKINIYYPVPTSYKVPGPAVFSG